VRVEVNVTHRDADGAVSHGLLDLRQRRQPGGHGAERVAQVVEAARGRDPRPLTRTLEGPVVGAELLTPRPPSPAPGARRRACPC
jgi:hypothetical protein